MEQSVVVLSTEMYLRQEYIMRILMHSQLTMYIAISQLTCTKFLLKILKRLKIQHHLQWQCKARIHQRHNKLNHQLKREKKKKLLNLPKNLFKNLGARKRKNNLSSFLRQRKPLRAKKLALLPLLRFLPRRERLKEKLSPNKSRLKGYKVLRSNIQRKIYRLKIFLGRYSELKGYCS